MRIASFTSVGAKLFYYMTGLVILTIVGLTAQFRKTFMQSQTRQVQESVQTQAEKTAAQIESVLDSWRAQIAVWLPTMRGDDSDKKIELLQVFVNSSPDFIALQLISAPSKISKHFVVFAQAFTDRSTDPRFEEKSSEQVKQGLIQESIKWLQAKVSKTVKSNVMLKNAGPSTGLPIAWIAVRFDVIGEKTVVWALLSVWQSQLVKALAHSKFIHTSIVDRDGYVFSSPTQSDLISKATFNVLPMASRSFQSTSPSGFVGEFKDANGNRRIGAYSRLPKYGLSILAEQDVEFAYQVLNSNLITTALWATLFILISIMFSYIGATGITKGLRVVADATSRIASGDFRSRIIVQSRDEVGLLGEAINNMSSQIVALLDSQVKKAQIEKELETAKIVQSTFFPKRDPSGKDLAVSSFYTPASECGGDLWGHFRISDEVEFVFIADAMGHGAPAALVTAMAYSSTMTVAEYFREDPGLALSPARILSRINSIIWEAVRGSISITFFASVLDLKNGTLTYANAGHNFPVLLPHNPKDPRLKNIKQNIKNSHYVPLSLKLMGSPLGIEPNCNFKDQTIELVAGDKLFYFTDGLIECESIDGEVLGRKWLLENISALGESNAEQLKQGILDRAFEFFGARPIKDDITVVVLELSKQWSPGEHSQPAKQPHAPPSTEEIEQDINPKNVTDLISKESHPLTPCSQPDFSVKTDSNLYLVDDQNTPRSAAQTSPETTAHEKRIGRIKLKPPSSA